MTEAADPGAVAIPLIRSGSVDDSNHQLRTATRARTWGARALRCTSIAFFSCVAVGPGGGELRAAAQSESRLAEPDRYQVVVDLDANLLHFRLGDLTLWSAPVGTGTGMRLIAENDEWDFSTPTGSYQVQYKERNPVWIAPDWFFLENDIPIPPRLSSSRYIPNALGAAAVYFHPTLAIHGTERPELLGRRVSHGCIRLENRYAMRLYHNVQVGTEVVIVGGEGGRNGPVVDLRQGPDPTLGSTLLGSPTPPRAEYSRWQSLGTPELLEELDAELAAPPSQSNWDDVMILLLERIRDEDEAALDGVFARAGALSSTPMKHEWGTFLTYAYRRATIRSLETLGGLDDELRETVAAMLVNASVALFHGDVSGPGVPWPSRHVPLALVTPSGRAGWDALEAAEREFTATPRHTISLSTKGRPREAGLL